MTRGVSVMANITVRNIVDVIFYDFIPEYVFLFAFCAAIGVCLYICAAIWTLFVMNLNIIFSKAFWRNVNAASFDLPAPKTTQITRWFNTIFRDNLFEESCAVCAEPIDCVIIPCMHAIMDHRCLTEWLNKSGNNTCPLCSNPIEGLLTQQLAWSKYELL